MFQNNETAAMLVFQTNLVGVKLFSYVKTAFVLINLIDAGHMDESALSAKAIIRSFKCNFVHMLNN